MRNINKIIIKAIYLRVLPFILVTFSCILVDMYTSGTSIEGLQPTTIVTLKQAYWIAISIMIPMIYLGWSAYKSECDK